MVRGKALSSDLRNVIIESWKNGISYKTISENLYLSKSTVQYIVSRFKLTGNIKVKKKSGCPRKTSSHDDRALRRIIKHSRRDTTAEIKNSWENHIRKQISLMTCRRRMKEMGYGFYKVKTRFFGNCIIS